MTTYAPNWRPRTCRAATAHELQWVTPTRAVCIHASGQCAAGVWLWRTPSGEPPRLVFQPHPTPPRGMRMQAWDGRLTDKAILAQERPK